MAGEITLSSAVRSNLLALQNTADLLGKTQEKLATGLKVNSALDDPTAFFTASSLNGRANDLSRLQDFVGNAVQTIKAADEGIKAITKLVESAEATARQALNSAGSTAKITGTTDISSPAGNATVTSTVDLSTTGDLGANLAGVADNDSFSITVGLESAETIVIADGDTISDVADTINGNANLSGQGVTASVTDGFLSITTTNGRTITLDDVTNTPLAALGFTDAKTTGLAGDSNNNGTGAAALGDDFTISVGGSTAVTIENDGNAARILSQLNAVANVSATLTDDGYLEVEATNGETLKITDGNGTLAADLGLSTTLTSASENADRTAFATQFNELRTQINQLSNDASYNGINLLDNDNLTVTFNEDATSTLAITGVNFNASGLGISSSQNNFQKDSDINLAISDLKGATDTLRAQASKFGSNLSVVETRQDFTKNLINVLETGAANLTLADTNEEGANLLALQTRQQLSSTALSLASQADQNVLRLF